MIKRIVYLESINRFRVFFTPFDSEMTRAIKTIPGREFKKEGQFWLIRPTSARHLFPFAVRFGFEYPPELKEAAEQFKNYDSLWVLPSVPHCIDLNGETIVIRAPERPPYNEREILRRLTGTGNRLRTNKNGWGWNGERCYWELPADLARANAKDIKSLAVDYMYLLTPEVNDLIGGL